MTRFHVLLCALFLMASLVLVLAARVDPAIHPASDPATGSVTQGHRGPGR